MTRAANRDDFTGNDGQWRSGVQRQLRHLLNVIAARVSRRDASGNLVFAEDLGGKGLARPFLAWSVTRDSIAESTTSGTFVGLFTGASHRQHPKVKAYLTVTGGASTTGEVRLVHVASGEVIAGPTAIPAGSSASVVWTATLPAGSHEDWTLLSVQARRASGANSVSVRVLGVEGVES